MFTFSAGNEIRTILRIVRRLEDKLEKIEEHLKMAPIMSAELSDAQGFGAIPKDWYTVRVADLVDEVSKKTSAPMAAFHLKVETGEYTGRNIFPPYRVMLGGKKEDGTNQNIDRLCEAISAFRIEWKCANCSVSGVRPLVKNEQMKYLCPDCGSQAKIIYNTDDFKDKVAKALVDQEKGFQSEEMVNRVARLAPLS